MISALIVIALAGGCSPTDPAARTDPAQTTLPPATTAMPIQTSTPVPNDTGWQVIRPGIEYREATVKVNGQLDRLRIARVDPAQVRFRVLYNPVQPRRVGEWLDSTRSLVVVNGSYFDPGNRALGLIISDSVIAGRSYVGFGGMFAVSGDAVSVRWNLTQPYIDGEGLTHAVQNYPMLVIPGGAPNLAIDDDGRLAPRTAVGQDRSGRILFVVSPGLAFTLTGLGQWLASSDLDLDVALNLDGGTSSGVLIRDGNNRRGVDSWIAVPDVIVVEAK